MRENRVVGRWVLSGVDREKSLGALDRAQEVFRWLRRQVGQTVSGVAGRLVRVVETAFGQCPLRIRACDGSEPGPSGVPVLVIRSARALRRLVWDPDDVGLGRAFVAGEIGVEGEVAAGGIPGGGPGAFAPARQGGGEQSLRRRKRFLSGCARAVDGVFLCLLVRGPRLLAGAGTVGETRSDLPQARVARGHAGARPGVRMGVVRHSRRARVQYARSGHHAVQGAGRAGTPAGGGTSGTPSSFPTGNCCRSRR